MSDTKVFDMCNFEKLDKMEDFFYNIKGEYFYSLNHTVVLELLCVNNMENAQIILSGLGSIKIKQNCFAKYNTLLLSGSSTVLLNGSYEISKLLHSHTDVNFTFLSNESIKNITFLKIEDFKLDTSQNLEHAYNYNNSHFLIIYSVLTILITTIVITFICIKCKKTQSKVKCRRYNV